MPALSRRLALASLPALATCAVPAMAAHPDAELIALCGRFIAADDASNAMSEPWLDVLGGPPDDVHAQIMAHTQVWHALSAEVGATPARTLAGLRAKAECAMRRFELNLDGELTAEEDDDYVAWSVTRDLLRLLPA